MRDKVGLRIAGTAVDREGADCPSRARAIEHGGRVPTGVSAVRAGIATREARVLYPGGADALDTIGARGRSLGYDGQVRRESVPAAPLT